MSGEARRPRHDAVVLGLERASRLAVRRGVTVPPVRGKLLRPRVALAFVPSERRHALDDAPGDPFWLGCLAVQMVHEASLQHDDVLDRGTARGNAPTVLARNGARAALLAGDLYLTGAYRVARLAESPPFLDDFMAGVETTVLGEQLQRELSAMADPAPVYEQVVRAKSGALFGVAAALPAWIEATCGRRAGTSPSELRDVGIRLGAFYQRVDDFLDYCPSTDTGKPKLQDFANRTWTSVLGDAGREWFDQTPAAAVDVFFRSGLAERAATRIGREGRALAADLARAAADPSLINLVTSWSERCLRATARGTSNPAQPAAATRPAAPTGRLAPPAPTAVAAMRTPLHATAATARVAARALALGPRSAWGGYFARNSRTFSFASLLLPPPERRLVREIYAFCRFTDDLVDGGPSGRDGRAGRSEGGAGRNDGGPGRSDGEAGWSDERPGRREGRGTAARSYRTLDAWEHLCRAAYEGDVTGIPLVDTVMGEMARRRIPFALAAELIAGVRMDVEPRRYRSMEELRRYTYRVASVVGAWLTQAFGVRDPWVLERAHALGHAMQLTNIIRDVGEDLALGRVYLPADRMAAHNLSRASLVRMRGRGALDAGYPALIEEMMAEADAHYEMAREGIPHLPTSFQRPVAVAAEAYRGIQDRVRANGYDNLTRRAYTSRRRKVVLAARGLRHLRHVPRPRRNRGRERSRDRDVRRLVPTLHE